jgi:diguanylate cyclase (GGDEF)-like protein
MRGNILFVIFIVSLILNIIAALKLYIHIKAFNSIKRAEELLFQLGDEIIKLKDMDEICNRILVTAIEIIPNADKGSLLILEEDEKFHFMSLVGYPEELKKLVLSKEELFLHKINAYKETAIINDPMAFDRKELMEEKAKVLNNHTGMIHCALSTPIYFDDKLIAVLNVDSVYRRKYFKQSDINLMNHIKNQLLLCLKNSYIRKELIYLTKYDDLTGIFNRRYFNQKLLEQLKEIKDEQERCYLVEIDLDDFKGINDCYGHAAGDKALVLFSKALKEALTDEHIYGRMSGDEFVIFFRNTSIECVYEKLKYIEQKLENNKDNIKVLFSYGITAVNTSNAERINDIYAAADMEMYKNKKMRKLWTSSEEE